MMSNGEWVLRDCMFSASRLVYDYGLVRRTYRKRGVIAAAGRVRSIAFVYVRQALLRFVLRKDRTFALRGRTYPYFWHWHVTTFLNERSVETPIVVDEVRRRRPERLLEFGNVLSHYFGCSHAVVDKYEIAPRVSNVDVVDYAADGLFDMIISISTLEHVGWDETPRESDKTIRAVENLRKFLAPGGRLVFTFPLGYNPHLDAHVAAGRLPFTEVQYLRRINLNNQWVEATATEVDGAMYGSPYVHGNAIAVGILDADPPSQPVQPS